MTCPHCGLLNPPEALRCDCGWDFASGRLKKSYAGHQGEDLREQRRAARAKTVGVTVGIATLIGLPVVSPGFLVSEAGWVILATISIVMGGLAGGLYYWLSGRI